MGKPIVEVMSHIYADAIGGTGFWQRMDKKNQAMTLAAMTEVVRHLDAFGLELSIQGWQTKPLPPQPARPLDPNRWNVRC